MVDRPTLFPLAAVGLALPAMLVLSDELLLSAAERGPEDVSAAFYVWLVAQTALLSFAAGKWLPGG
ncbi:MAG TPA: hypothetical protein VG826_22425 [Pirellulales bacterium]|nr:hypothetical protein [Pirellulales bacterium]